MQVRYQLRQRPVTCHATTGLSGQGRQKEQPKKPQARRGLALT